MIVSCLYFVSGYKRTEAGQRVLCTYVISLPIFRFWLNPEQCDPPQQHDCCHDRYWNCVTRGQNPGRVPQQESSTVTYLILR